MFRSISNKLRDILSNPYCLFFSFLLCFYIHNLLTTNIISQTNGIPLLDSFLFGYSSKEAHTVLSSLGVNGRAIYLSMYTRYYDIAFPVVLACVLMSMLGRCFPLFNNENPLKSKTSLFNLLPILYMVFDLLENYCHYQILVQYPSLSIEKFIFYGSYCCLIKYIFFFLCVALILIGFVLNTFYFIKSVIYNIKHNNNNNKKETSKNK